MEVYLQFPTLVRFPYVLKKPPESALKNLGAMRSLQSLSLSGLTISSKTLLELFGEPKAFLGNLITLKLNNTNVAVPVLEKIARHCTCVRVLRLTYLPSLNMNSAFPSLSSLSRLEELDLSRCPINDNGLHQLVAKLSRLRKLQLVETLSDGRGFKDVSFAMSLRELYLSELDGYNKEKGKPLSILGAEAIVQFRRVHTIALLTPTKNEISRMIFTPSSPYRKVCLSGGLSREDVHALSTCTSIQELRLCSMFCLNYEETELLAEKLKKLYYFSQTNSTKPRIIELKYSNASASSSSSFRSSSSPSSSSASTPLTNTECQSCIM